MPRSPFGSRPQIPREEQDSTPPRGTVVPDELARAMREPMPWWAALLLKKLDVDAELRQRDQRIGALEDLVDQHENQLSGSKVSSAAAEAERKKRREKWEDRAWGIFAAILAVAILAALQWIHVSPPATKSEPKVEVKP